MDIVFATGNPSKAKRFNKLEEYGINVKSLKDLNIKLNVLEDGKDRVENALIKARECFKVTGMPSMGMDDNLYFDGLSDEEQPGMFVRRLDKKNENSDQELIDYYIDIVNKYGTDGKIGCKWVYGIAVISQDGKEHTYTWEKGGFYMTNTVSSVVNPGYPLNSISKYNGCSKYFSEMTDSEKEEYSFNEDDVVLFIKNSLGM